MALPLRGILFITVAIISLGYWLYRRSFPRPIPGIPFRKESAETPFGDIPAVIKAPEPLSFFLERCHQMQTPIFQLFLEPFGRPSVVVVDARE